MRRAIMNTVGFIICGILILLCSFLLITGCSSQIMDRSLETVPFTVNENKVARTLGVPHSKLTGIYQGIDDMYGDSDCVVSAEVKDIENDMLIQYDYIDKEDSHIGDELLLFLTDSSDDTYKDHLVKLDDNAKLTYPESAYASLGIGMGKFTRIGDAYKRYNLYHTPDGTISKGTFGGIQQIRESYSTKEMDDELGKLR